MANNRLFLIHRPTGTVLFLGKRLSSGWHHFDRPVDINVFFDECEKVDFPLTAPLGNGPQDDFVLAIEDAEFAPGCTDKWKYDENSVPVLDAAEKDAETPQ